MKDQLSNLNQEKKNLSNSKDPVDLARLKQVNKEIADVKQSLKASNQELADVRKDMKLSEMSISELSVRIRQLKTEMRYLDPNTPQWKSLNAELGKTKSRMSELSNQAKATGGVLQKLSSIKMGVMAAFAAVAGAIRGVASAIGKIADFEQADANLSTIIGKNVNDIKRLTDSAMELGRTTEYTASQVTQLQTELAKLGYKEDSITQMQKAVLHFATGCELLSFFCIFRLIYSGCENVKQITIIQPEKDASYSHKMILAESFIILKEDLK